MSSISTRSQPPMSAEELARLSLGDTMVTTRAAAAKARMASAERRSNASSQSSRPSSQSSPPVSRPDTPSLLVSRFGLTYDVSSLNDDARKRAQQGFDENSAIKMKYCRMTESEPNQYMFYIYDDVSVVMGGQYDTPRCRCGANENGTACRHIFWLIDQLTSGAPESIKSQTLELSMDGSAVQNIRPSDMIDKMSLEAVAEGLEWVLDEGPRRDAEDIEEEITEMLSVFEPSDALPGEFKNDESLFLSERSRKYREFRELFTQYATDDLGLFNRLQSVIDPAFQAQVFFEKVNDRVNRAFKALDVYIANGPTDKPAESSDVVNCADKLKTLVKEVDEYYHTQVENDSDSRTVAIRAAGALINILDGVTNRNFDAYANIAWDGIPPTDPTQNNLFACLIGEPAEGEGLFVLDALMALPHDEVLRNHWDVLFNIGSRLDQQWTPQAFINAFNAVITEPKKRAGSYAEGSIPKRPMQ